MDDWVEDWQDDRHSQGDYMAMWRFTLRLCDDVQDDDSESIGMIGVDPLWLMVNTWPDETLTLLEAEASQNPTLLRALSVVITSEPSVRDRIDAILANDTERVNESDIQRTSDAWLAPRPMGPPPDWVVRWQGKRHGQGDYKIMWRFVLRLCEDVQDDDNEMIRMIGLDPLWLMVNTWPDETLTLIEAEAPKNPILLMALSVVLTRESSVRKRIEAILARQ